MKHVQEPVGGGGAFERGPTVSQHLAPERPYRHKSECHGDLNTRQPLASLYLKTRQPLASPYLKVSFGF